MMEQIPVISSQEIIQGREGSSEGAVVPVVYGKVRLSGIMAYTGDVELVDRIERNPNEVMTVDNTGVTITTTKIQSVVTPNFWKGRSISFIDQANIAGEVRKIIGYVAGAGGRGIFFTEAFSYAPENGKKFNVQDSVIAIAINEKIATYGDMAQAYLASVWYLLAMGPVTILDVFANDKRLLIGNASTKGAYRIDDSALFSDGTGDGVPTLTASESVIIAGPKVLSVGKIHSTLDDENWTTHGVGDCTFRAICFAKGMFIAVGDDGNIFTSVDGSNWFKQDNASDDTHTYDGVYFGVAYGNGMFVAVGSKAQASYSEDGITWIYNNVTPGYIDGPGNRCITFNGSIFCICTDSTLGDRGNFITSSDGIVWTTGISSFIKVNLTDIIWAKDRWFAVGGHWTVAGTYDYAGLYESVDGSSWVETQFTFGGSGLLTHYLRSIAWKQVFIQINVLGTLMTVTETMVITTHTKSFFTRAKLNGVWTVWELGDSIFTGGDVACVENIVRVIKDTFWLINPNRGVRFLSTTGIGNWDRSPVGTSTDAITGNAITNNAQAFVFDYVSRMSGVSWIYMPGAEVEGDGHDLRVVFNSGNEAPKVSFEMRREAVTGLEVSSLFDAEGVFIGHNPLAVIYEILENKQWGLGLSTELEIDTSSFDEMLDGCIGAVRNYGINLAFAELMSAQEILSLLFELTDIFVYAENGKIVASGLYNVLSASKGTITDDDFLSPLTIDKEAWADLNNEFEGEYTEPMMNYSKKTVYVKNEAAIEMADGSIRKKKIDLTPFITRYIASARLHEIMQRESRPKTTIVCEVNSQWDFLRPGDRVTVASEEYAFTKDYRVVAISFPENSSLSIQLDLQEPFEYLFDQNFVDPMAAQGTVPQSID